MFNEIDSYLKEKYTTYYATKNKEFSIATSIGWKKLGYYIEELNIAIEFNGDIFHGNPVYFRKEDTLIHLILRLLLKICGIMII